LFALVEFAAANESYRDSEAARKSARRRADAAARSAARERGSFCDAPRIKFFSASARRIRSSRPRRTSDRRSLSLALSRASSRLT